MNKCKYNIQGNFLCPIKEDFGPMAMSESQDPEDQPSRDQGILTGSQVYWNRQDPSKLGYNMIPSFRGPQYSVQPSSGSFAVSGYMGPESESVGHLADIRAHDFHNTKLHSIQRTYI